MKNYHLQVVSEARRLREESRQLIFHARRLVDELEKECDALEDDYIYSVRKFEESLRKNRRE